ncbi:MAG: hypothetical protein ORO03_05430, partial [Alphaproteobacteria bacterium]|nr:hypothetical protein [Alphaproteobacteria bacterium]
MIKARYATTLVMMCLLVGFGAQAALFDSAGASGSAALQPVLLAQTKIAPPEGVASSGDTGTPPAAAVTAPALPSGTGTGAASEAERPKGMVAHEPPPSVTSKQLTTRAATAAKKPVAPQKLKPKAAPRPKTAALPAPKKRAVVAAKSLPAVAAAAAPASSLAPAPTHRVTVRFGNHADFVRVVFDWDGVTDYSLRRDDNSLLLSFNRNAVVDLPSVYAALPQAIGVFEAGEENGNLVVAFSIPNNARYRDSRIGHLVIIDLLVPPNSQPTRPRGRLLPPPTVEPKREARSTPLPALPLAAKKESPAGAKESPAAVGTDARPPAVVAEPAANPLLPAASSPLPTTPATLSEQPTVTVPVFAVESTNARSLRFAFPGESGLAAFQRGSDLYVIFDRRALFDFSALGKGGEASWQT